VSPEAARAAGEAGGARVAVIERRGKFLVAEPFFGSGPRLAVSRDKRANIGDLVVVRQAAARNGRARGRAVIARRLGRGDVARDVIEAFMLDRGLRREFDPAVEREARDVASGTLGPDGASGGSDAGRRDLRSLPTFTIDPITARDYDDAISAAVQDDGWRVWVHIADVSAYVGPRSLIDREAYRRATSVYVRVRSSRCSRRRYRTTPARSSPARTDWRSRSR
jgi:ribonuclease R